VAKIVEEKKELTAAGTVSEFHALPFSSFARTKQRKYNY
jgi:hypothetical protein